MNEYLLPDIIVIEHPIPGALPFYYKNNFKSDITKRKTNCTEGPMLFKLLNCELNNIHGKLLNKILQKDMKKDILMNLLKSDSVIKDEFIINFKDVLVSDIEDFFFYWIKQI